MCSHRAGQGSNASVHATRLRSKATHATVPLLQSLMHMHAAKPGICWMCMRKPQGSIEDPSMLALA